MVRNGSDRDAEDFCRGPGVSSLACTWPTGAMALAVGGAAVGGTFEVVAPTMAGV
jgi:hypothetical protein